MHASDHAQKTRKPLGDQDTLTERKSQTMRGGGMNASLNGSMGNCAMKWGVQGIKDPDVHGGGAGHSFVLTPRVGLNRRNLG